MKPKDSSDPIAKRLDVIIRILMDFRKQQDDTLNSGDQLVFLETMHLPSTEAAHILGLDPNQLTSYRKRAKEGKKKVEQTN
jgi:hypothetical protein